MNITHKLFLCVFNVYTFHNSMTLTCFFCKRINFLCQINFWKDTNHRLLNDEKKNDMKTQR